MTDTYIANWSRLSHARQYALDNGPLAYNRFYNAEKDAKLKVLYDEDELLLGYLKDAKADITAFLGSTPKQRLGLWKNKSEAERASLIELSAEIARWSQLRDQVKASSADNKAWLASVKNDQKLSFTQYGPLVLFGGEGSDYHNELRKLAGSGWGTVHKGGRLPGELRVHYEAGSENLSDFKEAMRGVTERRIVQK